MRRLIYVALLALALAGCQTTIGPFAPREPKRVDDPRVSIPEQEAYGRERYALPVENPNVAPPSGNQYPYGK
jgi:hypothetical protein